MNDKIFFNKSNDNSIDVVQFNPENLENNIPVGVYRLSYSMPRGFYLSWVSDRMDVPDVRFGMVDKRVAHIMHRYQNSEKSLGVLMHGSKGAGKTMLANLLVNEALDMGQACVIIDHSFDGEITAIIEKLGNVTLMMDEFGKVFDKEDQNKILTLLDGRRTAKRLTIVTENSYGSINEFMKDRPSRFFYRFNYIKLEPEVIDEFCEAKNVTDENFLNNLKNYRDITSEFSFDTLQCLVDEHLMFGSDFEETVGILNVEKPISDARYFLTELYLDDKEHQLTLKHKYGVDAHDFDSYRNHGHYIDCKNIENLPEGFAENYADDDGDISLKANMRAVVKEHPDRVVIANTIKSGSDDHPDRVLIAVYKKPDNGLGMGHKRTNYDAF